MLKPQKDEKKLSSEIDAFERAVRSVRNQPESALHGIYARLIAASYGAEVTIQIDKYVRHGGVPDLTVSKDGAPMNWIEIKRVQVSLDSLSKQEQGQLDRYLNGLPHFVLTNGWTWRLFKNGKLNSRLDLSREWLTEELSLSPSKRRSLSAFLKRCAVLPSTNLSIAKPRRVPLYLPPELAKRLIVRCAEHDRSISDMGTEAIERYLLVTS